MTAITHGYVGDIHVVNVYKNVGDRVVGTSANFSRFSGERLPDGYLSPEMEKIEISALFPTERRWVDSVTSDNPGTGDNPGTIADSLSPIFINFSNHPSSGWSEKQTGAAANYAAASDGEDYFSPAKIVDIQFPSVPPTLGNGDEFRRLVTETVVSVIRACPSPLYGTAAAYLGQPAIHIMGEQSLAHAVTTLLQQCGYRVVVSTTERSVVEGTDGTKTSQFQFVRFRTIPNFQTVQPVELGRFDSIAAAQSLAAVSDHCVVTEQHSAATNVTTYVVTFRPPATSVVAR